MKTFKISYDWHGEHKTEVMESETAAEVMFTVEILHDLGAANLTIEELKN